MLIKLTKAIEILNNYKMESAFEATPDFEDALKLGIEAQKAIRDLRQGLVVDFELPLPGEQPEEIVK